MYVILFILAAVLFSAIAWRDLRLAVYVFAAALPCYLLRVEPFGIPTTQLEIFFWILTVVWIVRRRLPQHRQTIEDPTRGLGPWLPAIIVILLAATISLFTAPDLVAALGIWKAYFFEPIILFFLIRSLFPSENERWKLVDALGAGALFVAAIAVAQWMTGVGIPAPWDIERRVTSVFLYPNAVGLYLGPIMILGMFRLKRAWKLWLPTLLLSAIAIVAAQSEAAIAATIATAFFAGLSIRRTRRATIAAAVIAFLIVAAVPAWRMTIVEKLTLQDYSGQVRLSQWNETRDLLRDHPFFGAGLSGYPTALVPYHTRMEFEIFQYPHNVFLNTWVELGLLGLIGFLLLDIAIIRSAWIGRRQTIAIACFFALTETFIHGLVDVPYFKNDLSMMSWIMMAVLSLSYVGTKNVDGKPRS